MNEFSYPNCICLFKRADALSHTDVYLNPRCTASLFVSWGKCVAPLSLSFLICHIMVTLRASSPTPTFFFFLINSVLDIYRNQSFEKVKWCWLHHRLALKLSLHPFSQVFEIGPQSMDWAGSCLQSRPAL